MSDEPEQVESREAARPTMAELKRSIEQERLAETMGEAEAEAEPEAETEGEAEGRARTELAAPLATPLSRDDELLVDIPPTTHHLGRFAGWHAARKLRWIVGGVLGAAFLVGVIAFVHHSLELRHARLHPLPEVEALLGPGTTREATYTDGKFRVGLSREAPYINVVHLPDRDITLARGAETAQFKIEIRDGTTVKLTVLTGEIVETLTRADATALLED
jgi:hypothetical protein